MTEEKKEATCCLERFASPTGNRKACNIWTRRLYWSL